MLKTLETIGNKINYFNIYIKFYNDSNRSLSYAKPDSALPKNFFVN